MGLYYICNLYSIAHAHNKLNFKLIFIQFPFSTNDQGLILILVRFFTSPSDLSLLKLKVSKKKFVY